MDSSHSRDSAEQFHSTVWEEQDKEQMHQSSKSAQPSSALAYFCVMLNIRVLLSLCFWLLPAYAQVRVSILHNMCLGENMNTSPIKAACSAAIWLALRDRHTFPKKTSRQKPSSRPTSFAKIHLHCQLIFCQEGCCLLSVLKSFQNLANSTWNWNRYFYTPPQHMVQTHPQLTQEGWQVQLWGSWPLVQDCSLSFSIFTVNK